MGSTLAISREALDAMVAHAASSTDEVCGLLFGRGAVRSAHSCRNTHPDPRRHFEIDPAALITALRAMRAGGPEIIGYYHSHPGGRPWPSATDAEQAAPDGMIWLIVTGRQVAAFRAVAHGRLHGRFDPVTVLVAD